MHIVGALRGTAGLALIFSARVTQASSPANKHTPLLHERADSSNKTICGSETGKSGLKTNWYCAGEEPVCCRDSTTTLDEGIPWACIPAGGLCCGHGDYCSGASYCKRDGSDYACSYAGEEYPSLVGSTPQMESDWSGVEGDDSSDEDTEEGSGVTVGLGTSTIGLWAMMVTVLFLA